MYNLHGQTLLQARIPSTTSIILESKLKILVRHIANDDTDVTFYPHFRPLQFKATGEHLLGLVQLLFEYVVPISITTNNV